MQAVKQIFREAVDYYVALRAIRMVPEEREWYFEPPTLQIRLRQAYCILVAHKWTAGMIADPSGESDCVMLVQDCSRCGINRYDQCLTHDSVSEEIEEGWD